jgi:hypothetical protein
LQGPCQSRQVVPKNFPRKRKAPEYGALVFLAFRFISPPTGFQALGPCPMLVHGALKRCTGLQRCGDSNVGAGLPAKAPDQSIHLLTDTPPSRASPRLHSSSVGLRFSPHRLHHHPHHRPSSPAP